MNSFQNVNVDKKANIYFDGKVISRNIFLSDGSKKTLGVMLAGNYEFKTISRELMEIISGKLSLKRKDDENWISITEGMEFNIPKNSSFKLKVIDLVNYTCSYFDDWIKPYFIKNDYSINRKIKKWVDFY